MIRGTTPKLEFELPFDTNLVAEAFITFSQRSNVILHKTYKDCESEGQTMCLKLTQEETLSFDGNCPIEIQIRVRTTAGEALASDIFEEYIDQILKDGVI